MNQAEKTQRMRAKACCCSVLDSRPDGSSRAIASGWRRGVARTPRAEAKMIGITPPALSFKAARVALACGEPAVTWPPGALDWHIPSGRPSVASFRRRLLEKMMPTIVDESNKSTYPDDRIPPHGGRSPLAGESSDGGRPEGQGPGFTGDLPTMFEDSPGEGRAGRCSGISVWRLGDHPFLIHIKPGISNLSDIRQGRH